MCEGGRVLRFDAGRGRVAGCVDLHAQVMPRWMGGGGVACACSRAHHRDGGEAGGGVAHLRLARVRARVQGWGHRARASE